MTEKEPKREHRIEMEIIVDAYDEDERAMGWYYYLKDTIEFPFRAECDQQMAKSPLKKGEQVKVLDMASEDECTYGMWVEIEWESRQFAVPLEQLRAINPNEATEQALGDWGYWVRRGYRF